MIRRVLGFVVGLLAASCAPQDGPCGNGTCVCPVDGECDIPCAAPPCHLDCQDGSSCSGECANGDCTCRAHASCTFACAAPPCHVKCEGNNPQCDGACANGECSCGANSSCAFTCDAPPCHARCEAGSSCTLTCPSGANGDCNIVACDGEAVICDDGIVNACGAPCPA